MKWTEEDKATLEMMFNDGSTYREIGVVLGRTRGAIRKASKRMGHQREQRSHPVDLAKPWIGMKTRIEVLEDQLSAIEVLEERGHWVRHVSGIVAYVEASLSQVHRELELLKKSAHEPVLSGHRAWQIAKNADAKLAWYREHKEEIQSEMEALWADAEHRFQQALKS